MASLDRERRTPERRTAEPAPAGLPAAPRLLVIKPSSLGDIVQALPVLGAIRQAWPRAHIAWLVFDRFAALLDGHPEIDERLVLSYAEFARAWHSPRALAATVAFVDDLRRRRFDVAFDLQGLLRSAVLGWLSEAPEQVGLAEAREGAPALYTRRVPDPAGGRPVRHMGERYTDVIRALAPGVAPGSHGLVPAPEAVAHAERMLEAAGVIARLGEGVPLVLIVPFDRWGIKSPAPAVLTALADRLVDEAGARVVFCGAPSDAPRLAALLSSARHRHPDLSEATVPELVALLGRARVVVTGDTAPLHLASAVGTPTVGVFGPTAPARTGPWRVPHRIVTGVCDEGAMPCYRRRCSHVSCMRTLEVGALVTAVTDLLAAGPVATRSTARTAPESARPRIARESP